MNKKVFNDNLKFLVFNRNKKEISKNLLFSDNSNIVTNLNKTISLIKVYRDINLLDINHKHYKLISKKYSYLNLHRNFNKFSLFLRPYLIFRVECFSLLNKDIFVKQSENEFDEFVENSVQALDFNKYDPSSLVKFFIFYVNFVENKENVNINKFLINFSDEINVILHNIDETLQIKYAKSVLILFKKDAESMLKTVENFLVFISSNKDINNPYLLTIALKLTKELIEVRNEIGLLLLANISEKIFSEYKNFKLETINDYTKVYKLIKNWIVMSDRMQKVISFQILSYFLESVKNDSQLSLENKLYIVFLIFTNKDETIKLSFKMKLKEISEEISKEFDLRKKEFSERKLNELTKQLNTIINI